LARRKESITLKLNKKLVATQRLDLAHVNMMAEVQARVKEWSKLNAAEQKKAAILCIVNDFYLFCVRNLYIKNKKGQLVKLIPNAAQKALVEAVLKDLAEGRQVRYIVLKARQMGLSTIIEALCYWWASTHPYVQAAIAAHEAKANENIFRMFQRYYENTGKAFKPATKYYTKNELTFDNDKGTGLKSQISTFVAKGSTGRGGTNVFLHGSEVAFWENADEVVSGLLETVPMLPETFIFLESTANGVGGYFYDEWQLAKRGESEFKPFFFAWHGHEEYEMNVPPKMKLDTDERELCKMFKDLGYPEKSWKRKLMWRRSKLKRFKSNPDKFMQEYPSTDQEAFIASGRPVFNIKQLIQMERIAEREKFRYAYLHGNWKRVTAEFTDNSPLKIWDEPAKGEKYVIGVDVAEGLEHGDYSVVDVMRLRDLKTVARWRGHTDPDLLGEEVCAIGWYYNTALVGVESNNHGLTTLQRVRDKFYRNLYMREQGMEELFEQSTSKMGWLTNRKTKPLMIDELAKALRDNDIIDYDVTFIRECMTYVRDDRGLTNAQEGQHDDTVMAKAIALQLSNWYVPDRMELSVHRPIGRANYSSSVRPLRRKTKITLR
jgi:hypothetical protein